MHPNGKDSDAFVNSYCSQTAKMLAGRLGWHGTWCGGALPDGTGNCYVKVEDPRIASFTVIRKETTNA